MKTQLDKQQSQHLIDLGVSYKLASTSIGSTAKDKNGGIWSAVYYIFTLTDLLDMLPKEIKIENKEYSLIIEFNSLYAFAFYYRGNTPSLGKKRKEELIDSLYELCVWTLEQGYLKFK